jgi:hypothetical protein
LLKIRVKSKKSDFFESYVTYLLVNYQRIGPMSYDMDVVHVLNYASDGKLTDELLPFVLMKNGAVAKLGYVEG